MPSTTDDSLVEASAPRKSLTAAERLIWSGQRLDCESPLYNMALTIDVMGTVDGPMLQRAFQQVVQSEVVLRTVFQDDHGRPRRLILANVSVQIPTLDMPETEYDDAAVSRAFKDRAQRLLPLNEPLFDICIVQRRSNRTVLFLNLHHLITDAWSSTLLFRRISDAYTRLGAGVDTPTHVYPAFAEYVKHESAVRQSPQFARAKAYWDHAFREQATHVSYYGSHAKGTGRTHRIRVALGSNRTAGLRRIAAMKPFRALTSAQSNYLIFATVLMAWMRRVTDSSVVAFGAPWHNRSTADWRETLGLFIELYPLRITVDDTDTLLTLGQKVATATSAMMRHVVPGASESRGARGFSAVLNYITASFDSFAGMPTKLDWIHSDHGDPEHKLRLQVHDFGELGEPVLEFDLDIGVFDEHARQWAVQHFEQVFDALVTNPGQLIGDIPLVSWEDERRFVPRGDEHATPRSVLTGFRESTVRHRTKTAIVDGDQSLSYGELSARSAMLAGQLRTIGVLPDALVGICLDRSTELVVGLLGILEAGAAFVVLDPSLPDARLAFIAKDSGVDVVLTTFEYKDRVEAWGVHAAHVPDTPTAPMAFNADVTPACGYSPAADALAYVLYTSGSTGQPKGVEVTHGALADYVTWATTTYARGAPLRYALFTSPAFDLTLTCIFTPLLSGGSVVVFRDDDNAAAFLVRRVFENNTVDVVKLTPSHLRLVADLDLTASRLRRIIVGGEDFTTALATRIHDAFAGKVELFNEYGPTEATVACMIHRFDPLVDTGASVPIGVPAGNMRVHVLDHQAQPVLRGALGEIYIEGPRVARGYRGRPDLTAAAFVTVGEANVSRMYKTGDVGRWTADGHLEFHGRHDDQVKVRGVRLELGEVEAALVAHPHVHEAVADMVQITHRHAGAPKHCRQCGLEASHPEAMIDAHGVCAVCHQFDTRRDRTASYFGDIDDLSAILDEVKTDATGQYDCLMLYSGGKDSTYALCRIVEMGARPLVFMLDNGFISDEAKVNVRRVVDQLGLELVVGTTPAMPAVFAESLQRFSNVCDGCFKVIYTLAMNLAVERGIRTIVTGLSRGQIFETRLAHLYRQGTIDPAAVDRTILEARKAYHRMDDVVSREMDVRIFDTDEVLDTIQFVDFYRYVDVPLDDVLAYIDDHTPWIRPSDTGRSTNCLINQAGIYVHQLERGFHNYAMPYSWDVRLGHKQRDAALQELEDELQPANIRQMLDAVGYRVREPVARDARLVAYYTADADVPTSELRTFLAKSLPSEAIPSAFHRLAQIPLTTNGKRDRIALQQFIPDGPTRERVAVAPRTAVEQVIADIWSDILGLDDVSVDDDFFALGGDSMHCIQIVATAANQGLDFTPRELFAHPTIASLAAIVRSGTKRLAPTAATVSDAELAELAREFGS